MKASNTLELVLNNIRLNCIEEDAIYGRIDALFDGGEYIINFSYTCDGGTYIEGCMNIRTGAYCLCGLQLFGDYEKAASRIVTTYVEKLICSNSGIYKINISPEG